MSRSENAWLRHLFHRKCDRCYNAGYQKGWLAAHKASKKAVPDNPEAEREFRERLWRNEGAA